MAIAIFLFKPLGKLLRVMFRTFLSPALSPMILLSLLSILLP
ncbi:L,D-transpeptidase, partial [Arthrospira sp. O9.13F]